MEFRDFMSLTKFTFGVRQSVENAAVQCEMYCLLKPWNFEGTARTNQFCCGSSHHRLMWTLHRIRVVQNTWNSHWMIESPKWRTKASLATSCWKQHGLSVRFRHNTSDKAKQRISFISNLFEVCPVFFCALCTLPRHINCANKDELNSVEQPI